jgi:hypothetical protein
VRNEDVPSVAKKRDRFIVEFLTTGILLSDTVRRCRDTLRIMADAGTTYLFTPRRLSQPLIQMSSM